MFMTPKDGPESGPNGFGGTDPDFGQVSVLATRVIATFADPTTMKDLFTWNKNNFPNSSIKVEDQGFNVPELDPGSVARALTLLGGGVLTLTGRRLRKKSPSQPDRPGDR
jgi:hypothetical protein